MAGSRAVGTTIEFATTLVAGVRSITGPGPTADRLDATALDSVGAYREYVSGFKEPGEVTITCNYIATDPGQKKLRDEFATGLAAALEVTFPDNSAWSAQAFVSSWTDNVSVDAILERTFTLTLTGAVTFTEPV